ncbi:MAG: alpha/beta hydrolase [Lawsonibacter sp.]|nr:alpha/beta hydrolase [Lawsonibacter sp.]
MRDFFSEPRCDDRLDSDDLLHKQIGLPYSAPDGTQRYFDLYFPQEGNGPFPVIISVAGGGWYFGVPSSVHLGSTIHTAVARGYAVASMACTSSKYQKFPYQVQEIWGFIRHLRRCATRWNLDPSWTALWGASSGGHLSLMAALTIGNPEFMVHGGEEAATPSADVQAVAVIYPPCRLGCTEKDFQAIGLKSKFLRSGPLCMDSILLGVPVENNPELCRLASPSAYITSDAPPLLLLHGMADDVVSYSDSLDFARAYGEAIGYERVSARFLQGFGHGDPRFKTPEACGEILNFLDRVRLGDTPCPPFFQKNFFCIADTIF